MGNSQDASKQISVPPAATELFEFRYASRRDAASEFHRITIRCIAVGNFARCAATEELSRRTSPRDRPVSRRYL